MKSLLFVTPEIPFPPDKDGGSKVSFNIISNLKDVEIHLVYYGEKDENSEREILKYCKSVEYLYIKRPSRLSRIVSILRRRTYNQYRYRNDLRIDFDQFDIVVLDQYASAQFVKPSSAKMVGLVVDSMPVYYQRRYSNEIGFLSRLYYYLQFHFSKLEEKKQLSCFNRILFVSKDDAKATKKRFPSISENIETINLVPDSAEGFSPLGLEQSIVFTGVMDYPPNQDAALYFASEIFPELKKRNKKLNFYVVGRNPSSKLMKELSQIKGVLVTGEVESVYPYILGATICVSPLRFGAGVKNKVLEIMECCKPSVLSPVSVEGIPEAVDGYNCYIANDNSEWISRCLALIENPDIREAFQSNLNKTKLERTRTWSSAIDTILAN